MFDITLPAQSMLKSLLSGWWRIQICAYAEKVEAMDQTATWPKKLLYLQQF